MIGERLFLGLNPRFTICVVISSIYFGITIMLFNKINLIQSYPLVDEIFHFPQGEEYCHGDFTKWNRKITTPPGLYIFSLLFVWPLSWITGKEMCNLQALRGTNLLSFFINFYLLYALQTKLQNSKKTVQRRQLRYRLQPAQRSGVSGTVGESSCESAASCQESGGDDDGQKERGQIWSEECVSVLFECLSVVNISLFPVFYFFSFFYYTDVVSTMFVLLMYLLHLHNFNNIAAAAGFMAVFVRQSNVIWVAFAALLTTAQVLKREASLRKRKFSANAQRSTRFLKVLSRTLVLVWSSGWKSRMQFFMVLMKQIMGYSLVCIFFLIFVIKNNGIVLGDKTAHVAVIHIPQVLYFSLVCVGFCSPYFITNIPSFVNFVMSHKRKVLCYITVLLLIVHSNTLVHPYLLADNRHFTFYIWKYFFESRLWMKYSFVIFYVYGFFSFHEVLKSNNITFQLSYFLCLILSLVPQKLFELRYFIIPFIILRLQITRRKNWQVVLEFMTVALINMVVVHLFSTRYIFWSDSAHPQRFLW